MSIKILGGAARGIELAVPSSTQTRPTSVMLKRRLFDSIQDFTGVTFVDLCAGTGSIGLEALSRGAYEVYLVDKSNNAFQLLKTNIAKFKNHTELGSAFAIKSDVLKWLKLFFTKESAGRASDELMIFFDPPYEDIKLYKDIYQVLSDFNFRGRLVFEACQQKTMSLTQFEQEFSGPIKVFKQGTSFFAIYDFN
jgi:16S rRNA (guanine966-N2)-methyltransferase